MQDRFGCQLRSRVCKGVEYMSEPVSAGHRRHWKCVSRVRCRNFRGDPWPPRSRRQGRGGGGRGSG